MNPPIRKVLIVFDPHTAFSHGKLEGVRAYAQRAGGWQMRLAISHWSETAAFDVDGVLGSTSQRLIESVRAAGLPMVSPFTASEDDAVPRVHPDQAAAGRLAFDHLASRGLRSFASFRDRRPHLVAHRLRCAAFIRAAAERGLPADDFVHGPRLQAEGWSLEGQLQDLGEWLHSLPRPVGVFTGDDEHGWRVLEAAAIAGLRVPDDVAVIGCINDPVICNFSQPTLTSIELDQFRAGYAAAELLDRMMQGDAVPGDPVLIPPIGVIARQSTDTLAVDDELVVAAVRFIRDNVERSLDTEEVVRHIGLSRSALHRRCMKVLGRSVRNEITRAQLTRAKELLASSDMPLADIAARSGFGHTSQLARDIKLETGLTPMAYRKRFRRAPGG